MKDKFQSPEIWIALIIVGTVLYLFGLGDGRGRVCSELKYGIEDGSYVIRQTIIGEMGEEYLNRLREICRW